MIEFKRKHVMNIIFNHMRFPRLSGAYYPTFKINYMRMKNDKKIIISPWLSKMTCSKLNISNDKIYSLLPTEGRENYLEYHRNEVLKK